MHRGDSTRVLPAATRRHSPVPALLALDAATDRLHVGVTLAGECWLYEGAGGAGASGSLLRTIRALLCDAGIALHELDAIAFGGGPGAFTGLRTACSVAQGLATGAARPVLAIDTLQAVAQDAHDRSAALDVWVAMDARMDEVYAAHYRRDAGHWQAQVEPALYTLAALNARWRNAPPQLVAGTASGAFGARLDTGPAAVDAEARPRARALLDCARSEWLRGHAVDPAAALPRYLRNRVALTVAEREAAGARSAAP